MRTVGLTPVIYWIAKQTGTGLDIAQWVNDNCYYGTEFHILMRDSCFYRIGLAPVCIALWASFIQFLNKTAKSGIIGAYFIAKCICAIMMSVGSHQCKLKLIYVDIFNSC